MSTILSGLRDSASVYVALSLRASPERRAESDREHTQILEAYRRGDTEVATSLVVQHMRTTLVTLEEAHERGCSDAPLTKIEQVIEGSISRGALPGTA